MPSPARTRLLAGLGFTSLWIIGLSAFVLYPVLASLYYSFCDYSILQQPVWIGLENYQQLAGDQVFWISLRNTLIYAAVSVPLGVVVSLGLALLLNCDLRGRAFFRTLFYLPSIVPVVASSMLWLWIFNGEYGLLNATLAPVLGLWGGSPPSWLGDPDWAKPALILMSLWGVGNSMVIYLAGLQDVPRELYESSELDGAGAFRRFWHVTLPLISPVVYFNVIMGIIGAMQVFTQAFVLSAALNSGDGTLGSPARSTLFYAVQLYSTAFQDLRMGYASAMAWIFFVIVASLTLIANAIAKRRVHYSN
jgi:multiple sugar transport system permease protein